MRNIPFLETDDKSINRAFRIALGDVYSNIVPFKDGLLENKEEVVMAGMDYVTPWTRDAAINTWNGAGLLFPEVTKHTLLSVLGTFNGKIRIAGEYWDAIIWAIGAWWQYLYTGDKEFLKTAYIAIENSIHFFEDTELSPELNLFRGAACYGDGISAYPDVYSKVEGKSAGISKWPPANPELVSKPGEGIPMHVLSTNCLYYMAYKLLGEISKELGEKHDSIKLKENYHSTWEIKAQIIKNAINKELWDEEKGRYNYFVDSFGVCESQESMGISFTVLFGIADQDKAYKIFENTYVASAGIPCVWPSFERYNTPDGNGYGRHSGTVWPHIQGFWAHAAAICNKEEAFKHELYKLAEHVSRDCHFAEIYHPVTGKMYGGRQEWGNDCILEWQSCIKQTWSATAYLRMVLMGLIGMDFTPECIKFKPLIPEGINKLKLTGLRYRDMLIDIYIEGTGNVIQEFRVNGELCDFHRLNSDRMDKVIVSIIVV